MKNRQGLVKGTIILTGTGLLARFLGLYNRIYLANILSNEELGRYQLIFPVFMLCMAICSSGIQVAVSKMTAAFSGEKKTGAMEKTTYLALILSVSLAIACSTVLMVFPEWIAIHLLKAPTCAPFLRILALAVPFAAVHSCLSGFYYGCREIVVPACVQLFEQVARIGSITLLAVKWMKDGKIDASVAVWGLFAGECGAAVCIVICYSVRCYITRHLRKISADTHQIFSELFREAGFLTLNRVSVTLLQSTEMVLVPMMLTRYYADHSVALADFGVLSGMVVPVLAFPSTVTNAISTLLLPTVSEAESSHQFKMIAKTFEWSIGFGLSIGVFVCMGFAAYGDAIGRMLFGEALAGRLLRCFSISCPVMYIQPIFASALNGLGKMNETLLHHVVASGIRIGCILLLMPKYGISAYLAGMLLSNGVVSVAAYIRMNQLAGIRMHWIKDVLTPGCIAGGGIALIRRIKVPVYLSVLPIGVNTQWLIVQGLIFSAFFVIWMCYWKKWSIAVIE